MIDTAIFLCNRYWKLYCEHEEKLQRVPTLSFPVVLLHSPNLSPYLILNKLERNLFLIFISLLCLIHSHVLITKCLVLYVLS